MPKLKWGIADIALRGTALLSLFLIACATVHTSWTGRNSPVSEALTRLLTIGKPVSVAVLCEVSTTSSAEQFEKAGLDFDRWKESERARLITTAEQDLLEGYGREKEFHLVDRSKIDKVLAEQRFSISGAISNAIQLKLGEMLGATHLVLLESTTTFGKHATDDLNIRLIDVQTGSVLASQNQITVVTR